MDEAQAQVFGHGEDGNPKMRIAWLGLGEVGGARQAIGGGNRGSVGPPSERTF